MSPVRSAQIAPVVLRPMVATDRNFVIDTWLRSHHRRWYGPQLDRRAYWRGQNALVNALVDRCAVLCAAFEEDTDTILGWSCTSIGAVHYVWVRPEFRRTGIASQLLGPYLANPTLYTHPPTFGGLPIPKSWIYDPYAAFELAYTAASRPEPQPDSVLIEVHE